MKQNQQLEQRIVPYLAYEDGASAIEFLCRAFGFDERVRVPREDGTVMHAEIVYKDNVVMLGTPLDEEGHVRSLKGHQELPPRYSILCYVDDVDGHFGQAKASGAQIVLELQDRPDGSRLYAAADTEGHYWYFARLQGKTEQA
jgi:uncharacterized glyoxalase superfamily protein PhnB